MRISVTGTSGSGKTTFSESLSRALGAPHIDLDGINWRANWHDLSQKEPDEFRRLISAAAEAEAWVASGNYTMARPIVLARHAHRVAGLSQTHRHAPRHPTLLRARDQRR